MALLSSFFSASRGLFFSLLSPLGCLVGRYALLVRLLLCPNSPNDFIVGTLPLPSCNTGTDNREHGKTGCQPCAVAHAASSLSLLLRLLVLHSSPASLCGSQIARLLHELLCCSQLLLPLSCFLFASVDAA